MEDLKNQKHYLIKSKNETVNTIKHTRRQTVEDLKNQKHYLIKFRGETVNTKEIIDAILNSLVLKSSEAFDLGNALKYLIRFKNKNGNEDLKKARVYINYLLKENEDIEQLKKRNIELSNKNAELEVENELLSNTNYNLNLELSKKMRCL